MYRSATGSRIGIRYRRALSLVVWRFLFGEFAQALFFLLAFFFQISLALFKRVIWFCQNVIPDQHKPNKALHKLQSVKKPSAGDIAQQR